MNRKKYDRDLALKLYQELGTYSAVAKELGCSIGTAGQIVRRAQGLCTKCDNLPVEGHTMCEKHLEQNNANSRALRIKRNGLGICQRCGKEVDRDGSVCSSCAKIISSSSLSRGKEKVKQGLCYRCGQPIGIRSTWYCDDCLAKIGNESLARRSRLKSAGIC
jgi:predicted amidophosphoribosyltransferase